MSQPHHHTEDEILEAEKHDEKNIAHYDDQDQHGTLENVLHKQLAGTAVEDRQTAFELAMKADTGPRKWTWRWLRLYMIMVLMCLNQGDHGFDSTVIGSINSMQQYQNFFDLKGESSTKTGVVFGIGAAGTLAAFIPSYYVPDRYGRRFAMFFGNILPIVGNLLSGFAQNYNTLLAARIVGGMGFVGAAPVAYLAEISPPAQRGRILGFYNSSYYFGQIIATGICIPFGRTTSNLAWRIPFCLQALPLVILMASLFFIPESPRWLYAQGKHEEALKVLAYFHSRENDVNSPLIQLEMQEIIAQVDQDGAEKRWWDFRSLFSTRANTYRFLLGVVNLIWSQLAGNGLITYWLPVLIRDAGVTDTDKQRQYTFANSVTSLTGAMAGTAVVDHVGRRGLMLWASASCAVGMAICAALLSGQDKTNKTRTNAGIAFLMLFMVCFSSGWTPMQSLYPTEVLAYENRQKGNALRSLIGIVIGCFNSFALPVLLTKIKWKTMLMFMAMDIVGFCVIYAFAVETKRLSLEDLDEVFASSNPKKTSLALVKQAKRQAREEMANA